MWICPRCGREFKKKNQNHYCGQAPRSIDEYISQQDLSIQSILIDLRKAISSSIPEAKESISWGMPTWKNKNNIIHFAVNKNHIGIYVREDAIDFFKDQLKEFEVNKGNIHLKWNQDIPLLLIKEIAKWCFIMDEA